MKFDYDELKTDSGQVFFVCIAEPCVIFDCDIAPIIGLSLEEYKTILKSFGANENDDKEMIFESFFDCKKAIVYLKEKYGILLALLGRGC